MANHSDSESTCIPSKNTEVRADITRGQYGARMIRISLRAEGRIHEIVLGEGQARSLGKWMVDVTHDEQTTKST